MTWECKSCHRQIRLDPDPRGCDDEPICWHCLYEHRTALLEACEAFLACEHSPQTNEAKRDELAALLKMQEAVKAIKGEP